MAREIFVTSVRTAVKQSNLSVQTDSSRLDAPQRRGMLERCDFWLTIKTVDGFDPADFTELSPKERDVLRQEVKRFTAVARSVPSNAPATADQVREAGTHFARIVELTRRAEIVEWQNALKEMFRQVEDWSRQQRWGVNREIKLISEPFLAEYEAPRLLIHTLDNKRLFLDPVARYVTAANGLVELCLLPSYDSIAIVRREDDWVVNPDRPSGRTQRWSHERFLKTVAQLAEALIWASTQLLVQVLQPAAADLVSGTY